MRKVMIVVTTVMQKLSINCIVNLRIDKEDKVKREGERFGSFISQIMDYLFEIEYLGKYCNQGTLSDL